MKSSIKVQVLMNTDLVNVLNQTGQYEDLINGLIKCECCGREITLDSIRTLVPYKEQGAIKIRFYCNHFECVNCEK